MPCAPTRAALTALRPVEPAAAILDGVTQSVTETESLVSAAHDVLADAPLVLYSDLGASVEALLEHARRGGTAIVVVDAAREPVVEFRAVARAFAARLARDIAAEFGDPLLARLAECVVSGACSDLTAPQLAAAAGIPYKRLRRFLACRGIVSPRILIQWGRLVFASWLLPRRWRSVGQLARDLGWHDDAPLEATARALSGMSPRALRRSDQYPNVKAAFIRALRAREN